MQEIKGVIFDYGGTIDTNGDHWAEVIWEQYLAAKTNIGKELFREAYVHGERTLAKRPIIEPCDTFKILLEKKIAIQAEYLFEKGYSLSDTQKERISSGCYQRVLSTLDTTRNVVATLSKRYPMVLVTNFYGNMPVVLREFKLDSFFGKIIESSVVGIRKPDPALYAMGVEALSLPAENILVVGDSYRKDIYPASTLGCRTAWIKGKVWEEEKIEPQAMPTVTISNIAELTDILG